MRVCPPPPASAGGSEVPSSHLRRRLGRARPLLSLLLILTLLPVACTTPQEKKETIRIGIVPKESPEITRQYFRPFIQYLEKETGLSIEVFVPTDYSAVVTALAANKVDVALLGAVTYIQASKRAKVHPFAKAVIDGSSNYHSVIITRIDKPFEQLTDLKGHTFAFGDISSTSGHLIPHQGLLAAGVDPKKDFKESPIYTGAHNATALAVYNGKTDAGAVEEPVLNAMVKQGLIDISRLKIIWRSEPIPQYPWVIRDMINDKTEEKIVAAFLSAPRDIIPSSVGEGFVFARGADYDELRKIAERLGLAGQQ